MELIHDEVSDRIVETARRLAEEKHIDKLSVRDILKELNCTNRVFYNRFRNMDEVLDILYREEVERLRKSLFAPFEKDGDFGAYIEQIAVGTLLMSYERQQHMSQYIFRVDSTDSRNRDWWSRAICRIVRQGAELGYFRSGLDEEAVSYSIWCFIRGFNADAVGRGLPRDEAVKLFTYGFRCFLTGLCS